MVKVTKKILALIMVWGLFATSAFGTREGSEVYAAEKVKVKAAAEVKAPTSDGTDNKNQAAAGLTEGKVLGAYDFDGLRVTFNGKEIYTVKKGEQSVTLSVTVLDEKKAKVGISQLILAFGPMDIVNKKGVTTVRALTVAAKVPEQKDAAKAPVASQPQPASGSGEEEGTSSDDEDDEPEKDLLTGYRTIIMYLVGSDIESEGCNMSKQLLDMLESDIPKSVRIILVTGGSEVWHMDDYECYSKYAVQSLFPNRTSYDKCTDEEKARIDDKAEELLKKYGTEISGVQIWEIESAQSTNSLKLLRTMENEFMINSAFLTESINFATNTAPAQRYDLIISGHGNGIQGFGKDDLYNAWMIDHPTEEPIYGKMMSISSLAEAIEASELVQNGGKFELLGADSCVMGSFEVAYVLSKCAEYYVASEEFEPDSGWNYSDIISAVRNNPLITGEGLAKVIANSYARQYAGTDFTMSGVDMKQVERLDEAVTEFANCLYSESYENYSRIMRDLGGDSHLNYRYGLLASNLYDLKRIAVSFSEDERLSEELRSASHKLVSVLSDAVIANFGGKDENGGLNIFFPRHAFNTNELYIVSNGQTYLDLYEECGINESYEEAVKKLAFRDVVGFCLGDFFSEKEKDISTDDVLNLINSSLDMRAIVNMVEFDRNDPEDPYVGLIQRMIDERVHSGKITVTTPERIHDDDEHWHYADEADVNVTGADSESIDGRIFVEVTLDDLGTSLGTTIAYSDEMISEEEDGKDNLDYYVTAFDQKWYTLNGQIAGMNITQVKEDGSGFYGHIPLLLWKSAEYAAGTEEDNQNRNQYLLDAEDEVLFKKVWLNVECNVSTDDEGKVQQNLTPVNVENVDEEELDEGRYLDTEKCVSRYYELLGGNDGTYILNDETDCSSLGTIYIDSQGTINIDTAYVENLSPTYYFTDVYGNDYEMTEEFLGEDEDGNSKGMEDFCEPIPADVPEEKIVTWEESQALAEQVRQQAAQEAKAAEEARAEEEKQETQGAEDAQEVQKVQEVQGAEEEQAYQAGEAGEQAEDGGEVIPEVVNF